MKWYISSYNLLGGSVDITKKKAETLAVASKEFGLEVNAH
jgi:hypothetical protein